MKAVAVLHQSKVAQENVKQYSYEDDESEIDDELFNEFIGDDTDPADIVKYGKKEAIRANSPFYAFFLNFIDKLKMSEHDSSPIVNPFWCPEVMKKLVKQYLSLFPLISACFLPDDCHGLRNNAYVELYWQEQRRILKKVPNRLLWPPQYLGLMDKEIRLKAAEIKAKGFIPNIRTGGKVKIKKSVTFLEKDDSDVASMKASPKVSCIYK